MLKYQRGDASDHVPLEPEVPAQDANELWSVQRYSTEECDGRSNSSSTQVQLVMRGKRRFQEELNLNRLAVQFSAVQHRVSAASCGHDPEDDLDRNHAQVEEGCRDCPHFPSPHVNLTTRNHSTTRKSWRSDAPIILPGWEYHTGGSRSKPTVHRCRPKTGGCGLLTRTQNEPTKQHGSGVENQQSGTEFYYQWCCRHLHLIAHHIVAQVARVSHVIHACSERHPSTLSSPFHPTSSYPCSSSISCSPCCTSFTTLRAVVTLRTRAKKEMMSSDESYLTTFSSMSDFNIITMDQMKKMRIFEQFVLKIPARGIVVSLYLAFSLHGRFLPFCLYTLVDVRIPHVVIVNSTPHTSPFSRSQRMMCDTTLAQVFVRVISSMCHAPECLLFSLRPSL